VRELRKGTTAGIVAGILVIGGMAAALQARGPVTPSSGTRTRTPAATPPDDLTVLIAGDSVPLHMVDTLGPLLEDTLGATLVSAAVPVCSIYGDPLARPTGEPKGDPSRCPGLVVSSQSSLVQQHDPDVVIWWDRLSTMPILTADGGFVRSGTDQWWELRSDAFDETLARLRARALAVRSLRATRAPETRRSRALDLPGT